MQAERTSPKLLPLMKEQKNTIKYERMKESITWRYKQTRERKRERKQNKKNYYN